MLRFNFDTLPSPDLLLLYTPIFCALSAIAFLAFGVQRGVWRFTSVTDLRNIVLASTAAVLVFLLGIFLMNRLALIPRSVPVIAWFVMIILLSAPRVAYRVFRARTGGADNNRKRLLLIATAPEADALIREFRLENNPGYAVVGIVALEKNLAGRWVRGIEVLGDADDLDAVMAKAVRKAQKPDALVVARPREHPGEVRRITAFAATQRLPMVRMAETGPILGSGTKLDPLTLDDLLGRPPVRLDAERIRSLIEGRTVLVTCAGGSIGSEIVRQIANEKPRRLVAVDSSEYALYTIDQELGRAHPELEWESVIASVRDRATMFRLMAATRPEIVFHAAALKHVPLIEANPCEGVLTNLDGTRNVADAAAASGAEAMVMVSTDKAIRPSSIMGATKRAAESYCQALDVSGVGTRFITVRFGNVLGSTGSVVPLFERQIQAGGPVTVTHPEMRRYFMSIREATELVLHAAAHGLANQERRGSIVVLDMGEPVRIVDLARTMIAMSGRIPDVDIPIVFTGIRSGEKLFEELFDPRETNGPAPVDGLIIATPRMVEMAKLRPQFDAIAAAALRGSEAEVLRLLQEIVVEYQAPDDRRAEEVEDGRLAVAR
ncbi:nucleoside-diphosphate sugar epimerase/dehydratase [soil metagenome]